MLKYDDANSQFVEYPISDSLACSEDIPKYFKYVMTSPFKVMIFGGLEIETNLSSDRAFEITMK